MRYRDPKLLERWLFRIPKATYSSELWLWLLCQDRFGLQNPYEGLIPPDLKMTSTNDFMAWSTDSITQLGRIISAEMFQDNLDFFHTLLRVTVCTRQGLAVQDIPDLLDSEDVVVKKLFALASINNIRSRHRNKTYPFIGPWDLSNIEEGWAQLTVEANKKISKNPILLTMQESKAKFVKQAQTNPNRMSLHSLIEKKIKLMREIFVPHTSHASHHTQISDSDNEDLVLENGITHAESHRNSTHAKSPPRRPNGNSFIIDANRALLILRSAGSQRQHSSFIIDANRALLILRSTGSRKQPACEVRAANRMKRTFADQYTGDEQDEDGEEPSSNIDSEARKARQSSNANVEVVEDTEDDDDSGQEYEVDRIIEDWTDVSGDNTRYYKISWKGYPESANSWEPDSNITSQVTIDRYWNRKKKEAANEARKKRAKRAREEARLPEEHARIKRLCTGVVMANGLPQTRASIATRIVPPASAKVPDENTITKRIERNSVMVDDDSEAMSDSNVDSVGNFTVMKPIPPLPQSQRQILRLVYNKSANAEYQKQRPLSSLQLAKIQSSSRFPDSRIENAYKTPPISYSSESNSEREGGPMTNNGIFNPLNRLDDVSQAPHPSHIARAQESSSFGDFRLPSPNSVAVRPSLSRNQSTATGSIHQWPSTTIQKPASYPRDTERTNSENEMNMFDSEIDTIVSSSPRPSVNSHKDETLAKKLEMVTKELSAVKTELETEKIKNELSAVIAQLETERVKNELSAVKAQLETKSREIEKLIASKKAAQNEFSVAGPTNGNITHTAASLKAFHQKNNTPEQQAANTIVRNLREQERGARRLLSEIGSRGQDAFQRLWLIFEEEKREAVAELSKPPRTDSSETNRRI